MWLTPAQGTVRARTRRKVCALRKSRPPVDGEVQVVGIVDRKRLSRPAGERIDRRQRVTDVVVDVERLQVVRRRDVLRQGADREVIDHPVGARVDDVHRVAGAVGNVDPGQGLTRGRADHPGLVVGVQVELAGMGKAPMDEFRLLRVDRGRREARPGERAVAPIPVPDDQADSGADQSEGQDVRNAHTPPGSPSWPGRHRPP